MTKEEFDVMGITEMDLVCVSTFSFSFRFAPKKTGLLIVCNIIDNDRRLAEEFGETYTFTDANIPLMRLSARFDVEYKNFIPVDHVLLSEIKSIEIIKKDFWK